jgi:hypothetical protein
LSHALMVLGSSLRNGCVVDKPTFNLARSRRSDGRSISPSCDMQHQAFDVHLVEFHPADLGYAQRMPEDQQQQATVAGFIPAPLRGQIKATIQAAQRQTRLTALQRLDLALLHCQVNNPREFGHSGPSPRHRITTELGIVRLFLQRLIKCARRTVEANAT